MTDITVPFFPPCRTVVLREGPGSFFYCGYLRTTWGKKGGSPIPLAGEGPRVPHAVFGDEMERWLARQGGYTV